MFHVLRNRITQNLLNDLIKKNNWKFRLIWVPANNETSTRLRPVRPTLTLHGVSKTLTALFTLSNALMNWLAKSYDLVLRYLDQLTAILKCIIGLHPYMPMWQCSGHLCERNQSWFLLIAVRCPVDEGVQSAARSLSPIRKQFFLVELEGDPKPSPACTLSSELTSDS